VGQFLTEPLVITFPFRLSNYVIAFNVLKRSILNSMGMATAIVFGSMALASFAAYAFARFRFPGKEAFYWLIIGVLFLPNIATFATTYTLVDGFGWLNTYIVQVMPYMASAQVFQAIVLRSFFAGISEEVVDAARADGASVLTIFLRIILPMSRPILATLAVMRVINYWDEWLWPSVTITKFELRPMALQVYYLAGDVGPDIGLQMAGFVMASLPLVILFIIASRQFVEGLTSGAIKF
jgi:ABC-type glycerol-3-phosphate transport system permease component